MTTNLSKYKKQAKAIGLNGAKSTGKRAFKPFFDYGKNGLNGLGALSPETDALMLKYKDNLACIVDEIEREQNLKGTWTFDDTDLIYNRGITTAQKQAWVYYKRSFLKIPMTGGWSKYYLKGSQTEPFGTTDELNQLVLNGALFFSDNLYKPLAVFTWGNMYDRIAKLAQDKDYIISQFGNDVYLNHLTLLNESKPKQIRIDDADENKRAIILAISPLAKTFLIKEVNAEYMTDVNQAQQKDYKGQKFNKKKAINITFNEESEYALRYVFVKWLYTLDIRLNFSAGIGPYEVDNFYVHGYPMTQSYKEQTSLSEFEVRQLSQADGEKLFAQFINEVITPEDIQRLNDAFNSKYNAWADLKYSAIPIGMDISKQFNGFGLGIRPEKREAIAYMEAVGSGILAYDVGVGKTLSALLELANALHQGKCKRPLVVVPNPTYKNWLKEALGGVDKETGEVFTGVLSGLGYKANDWYNLGTDITEKLDKQGIFDVQVPTGTITFITYEGLKKIGFSKTETDKLIPQFIDILEQRNIDPELEMKSGSIPSLKGFSKQEIEEAAQFGGLAGTERNKAKDEKSITELIGKALENTICDIDTLGFDYIIIDEAHRCKKIFTSIKADEDGKSDYTLNSGEPSSTGLKAFCLCNYIQRTHGRNVMLLTATPFTNSPLEVYSMLSLVGYDLLVQNGYYNINDFFKQFANKTTEYVVTAGGEVKIKQIIKGFNNRLILQKLIFTKVNYKTGEDVGVNRPTKINLPILTNKANVLDVTGFNGLGKIQQITEFKVGQIFKKVGRLDSPETIKKINKVAKEGEYDWYLDLDSGIEIKIDEDTINEFYQAVSNRKQTIEPNIERSKAKVSESLPMNKQVLTYLEQTPLQAELQDIVYKMANAKVNGKPDMKAILQALSASLDNALSPYLFSYPPIPPPADYKEFVNNSPKVKYVLECVRTVKKYHEDRKENVSGQVLYLNRGKKFFQMIKEYLIKDIGYNNKVQFEGRAISEVMIMEGATAQADREFIKDAFNAGVCKIIIGSSTIREGINLQKYGTVLYDMYPDWNPTDVRQLEGRIWRQGNTFGFVRVVMPLVENSMDVFVFQKLEEKTSRINDLFYKEGTANVLDLDSIDPNQIKYALIKDINQLVKIDFSVERSKANTAVLLLGEDAEAIKQLQHLLELLNDKRQDAINYLERAVIAFSEQINRWSNKRDLEDYEKDGIKKAQVLVNDIQNYLATTKDDEQLIRFALRLENFLGKYGYMNDVQYAAYRCKNFTNAYREIKKAERTILKPKGYSLDNNFTEIFKAVSAEYAKKLNDFNAIYGVSDNAEDWKETPRYAILYNEIVAKKEALNVNGKPPLERVKEFASLNYLLQYKAKKTSNIQCGVATVSNTCPPTDSTGNVRIDNEGLKLLTKCIENEPETKSQNIDAKGNYNPTRLALHQSIIEEIKGQKPCKVENKPIAILTGGAPGSGKSTFLKKFASWVTNGQKVYNIDADEVRAKLPEYKGWNAFNTHKETRDIVNTLLNEIGNPCEHDIVYDGTMNKVDNYLPLIAKLKKMGYKVFIIYMQVDYMTSVERAMNRYKNGFAKTGKGRYVPIEVIDEVFSKGLDAYEQLIKQVDGFIRVDGNTQQIIERGGMELPKDRNYDFKQEISETEITPKGKVKSKLTLYKYKAKAIIIKLKLKN